jgi:hypothetical protein
MPEQGKLKIINQKLTIPKTNTNFIPPIAYCKNTKENMHKTEAQR